ncbi:YDG domain-containing protein [Flavobacterium myungsuense]|uniref:YDG domain-containing protein n=1 Tax=Flavobacterium myungsuense TaxID=651823 RepID=UPI003641FF91
MSGIQNSETVGSVTLTYGTGTAATTAVGTYSTITPSSATGGTFTASNYAITYTLGNIIVESKTLTIGTPTIASKAYDATTNAGAVTLGALSGFIGTETVTATATAANYSSANVGSYPGTVVTYTLANGLNGGLASNYSLANGSATGTITAKVLTIGTPTIVSKAYDATTTTGAVTLGTLSGFIGSQTVTATATAANYSSANVGPYPGTVITYTLANGTNGGLATNYSLANGSATGAITAKVLTIGTPTIASKVYDATTTAGAVTLGTLSGFIGTQTVTATATSANYSSANVGSYPGTVITYTLANGTNGGLATNYSLANGSATGVITAKALTIGVPTIASKAYDGTTTAGAVTEVCFRVL